MKQVVGVVIQTEDWVIFLSAISRISQPKKEEKARLLIGTHDSLIFTAFQVLVVSKEALQSMLQTETIWTGSFRINS